MGVYNGESSLPETLNSLLNQSYRNWELIAVDDASTDRTLRVLNEYAAIDDRIKIVHLEHNKGLTHALLVASEGARGEILARQDAGDISLPHRLDVQVRYMDENPSVVAVGPGVRRIGPLGEHLGDCVRQLTPNEVTAVFRSTGKAITHAGAMIRRSAFDAAGGYRLQFRVAQDIDLWYRLSQFGQLGEIEEVLFCVRIDASGISARSNAMQHALAAIARASFLKHSDNASQIELLEEASRISGLRQNDATNNVDRKLSGEGNFFLGSELFNSCHPNCRRYLLQSMLRGTHIFGSLCKYILSFARCSSPIQTIRATTPRFLNDQRSSS